MSPASAPPPPYRIVEAKGPHEVRLRFAGRFEGRAVVWEATVRSLRAPAPQYLEVGAASGRHVPIAIGLRVAALDPPTLHKAVIMVRRYKGLRRGRHEFSP